MATNHSMTAAYDYSVSFPPGPLGMELEPVLTSPPLYRIHPSSSPSSLNTATAATAVTRTGCRVVQFIGENSFGRNCGKVRAGDVVISVRGVDVVGEEYGIIVNKLKEKGGKIVEFRRFGGRDENIENENAEDVENVKDAAIGYNETTENYAAPSTRGKTAPKTAAEVFSPSAVQRRSSSLPPPRGADSPPPQSFFSNLLNPLKTTLSSTLLTHTESEFSSLVTKKDTLMRQLTHLRSEMMSSDEHRKEMEGKLCVMSNVNNLKSRHLASLEGENQKLKRYIEELEARGDQLASTNEDLMTSNERLTTSNEQLTIINSQVSAKNGDLLTKSDELVKKNDELTAKNEELAEKNDELVIKSKNLSTSYGDLVTTNQQLDMTNQRLTSTNDNLTKANENMTKVNENLTKSNQHLTKENEAFSQQSEQVTNLHQRALEHQSSSLHQISLHKAELSRLTAENSDLTTQLEQTREDLNETMDEVVNLRNVIADQEEAEETMKEEMATLQSDLLSLSQTLESSSTTSSTQSETVSKLKSLCTGLDFENRNLTRRIEVMTAEHDEHKNVILQSEKTISDYKAIVHQQDVEMRNRAEALAAEIDAKETAQNVASNLQNDVDAMKNTEAELANAISQSERTIAELKAAVHEKDVDLESSAEALKAERSAKVAANTSASSLQTQIEVDRELKETEHRALKQEIDSLRGRIPEMNRIEGENSLLREDLNMLREDLNERTGQVNVLKRQLQEKLSQNLDLEGRLQQSLEKTETMLKSKQSEFKTLLDEVSDMQKKHATTIDTRDLKISQLELSLAETTARLETVTFENEDLTTAKQSQIADLVAQVNGFSRVLSDEREASASLQCDLVAKNAGIRFERDEVVDVKDNEIKELREKLDAAGAERGKLEGSIKKLTSKLEKLTSSTKADESDAESRCMDALDMVEEREKIIIAVQTELEKKEQEILALTKHMEMVNGRVAGLKETSTRCEKLQSDLDHALIELSQLRSVVTNADNARLDIAMEKEAMVRENARTKKMAAGLEKMLKSMQERNGELSAELERVKKITSSTTTAMVATSTTSPARKNVEASEARLLSPTFTESLTKRHDAVIEELNIMKRNISTSLTPRKRRADDSDGDDDNDSSLMSAFEQKNELLRQMEGQVEVLVERLTKASEDLAEKDELLGSMADAIGDYEEERENLRGELKELGDFVDSAEEMVKRESELREMAEAEFAILKRDMAEQQMALKRSLENTNESQSQQANLQSKLLQKEADWSIKFEAAQQICGGLAAILGGAFLIKKNKEKKVVFAFMKWREFAAAGGNALEEEKAKNSQLLVTNSSEMSEKEEIILDLERSNAHLRGCLEASEKQTTEERRRGEMKEASNAQLTKNSNEILESSRIMRCEMEKNLEFSSLKLKLGGGAFLRGILVRRHARVVGGAWRRWLTMVMVTREMEAQGKVAKKMANQLVDTKNKLLKLKSQLRAGGFLPSGGIGSVEGGKLAKMNGVTVNNLRRVEQLKDDNNSGNRNENLCTSPTESTASSNFCWDLSSDEEEEILTK